MRVTTTAMLGLMIGGMLALPSPSLAQSHSEMAAARDLAPIDNPHLGEARRQIEAGELVKAGKALDRAMSWPRNDNRTLIEIYRTMAVVHFYNGAQDLAYEDLTRVLNIDLSYHLPNSTAAPLRKLLERVRKAYTDGLLKPVRVAHDPPLLALPGATVRIAATIANLRPTLRAVVRFRPKGANTWSELPLQQRPGNRFGVDLPANQPPSGAQELFVEYYLEVQDTLGRRVQGRGSALTPLTYLIEAPGALTRPEVKRNTWYRSPWLWTAVGVIAVGSAAGIAVAAGGSRGGSLTLHITVTR